MLLAIFFIVIGSVELIKGVILIAKKVNVIATVITFIIAALFIAGGVLALIYRGDIKLAFCIIAGGLLFIAGVALLILGIRLMVEQGKNKEKKPAKKGKGKETKKEEVQELDYTKE